MSEPSAHVDTFAADHLPPRELWPTIEHTTERLRQHPPRLNASAALLDATIERRGGDAPALRTPDGTTWSYDDLRRRSAQVAEVLVEDLGLVPGNRVLLRSPNNLSVVACWLGVLRAGGVVVTTMAALRARELEPVVQRTRPSIVLVDHRHVDDVLGLDNVTVVALGGDAEDDLVRRAEARPGVLEPVDTSADDVALLGPTSGSTGTPKITMHTHRDLLAIDDTFGTTLALGPGEEGRLAVIGPVGCRYLDDEERQRSYVVDGWNVTGDTFRVDDDGYFTYCARTDDLIVSSGYNIGGPEVEAVVGEHPDVVEVGVVAKPDPDRGSVVCAFVVLADGVAGDAHKAREIQDFVKSRLAPYKYPRDVRFTDSLPRNASGKLQHFRLRETLEENAS